MGFSRAGKAERSASETCRTTKVAAATDTLASATPSRRLATASIFAAQDAQSMPETR